MSDEIAEVDLEYRVETDMAIGFLGPDSDEGDDLIWLPKSQIEIEDHDWIDLEEQKRRMRNRAF